MKWSENLLTLEKLQAGYGPAQVLFDISFTIEKGEVVTLLGRNGMGKTTTVKTIMGLLPAMSGRVSIDGKAVTGSPPFKIARCGLGLVPEGRQIFPTLSVEENLIATATSRSGRSSWTLDRVYSFFPRLKERRANMGHALSGGEQQMLAIGRALMTNPRLLILDEATEGLAPLIRQEIWDCLNHLRQERQSILLIDKHIHSLLKLADRHVVIEKGHVAWTGTSTELSADPGIKRRYLQA